MGGKIHEGHVTGALHNSQNPRIQRLALCTQSQDLSHSKQTEDNDIKVLWQMQSAHNTPVTIFPTSSYECREAFESCAQRWEQSRVFLCADAERWGEMGEMRHWSVLISCLLSCYSHTHTCDINEAQRKNNTNFSRDKESCSNPKLNPHKC